MAETKNKKNATVADVLRMNPLFQIHLGLADTCNMNCQHCTNSATRFINVNQIAMSQKQWRKILADAIQLGCFKVNLVHGEPLLARGLLPFLADAIASDMEVEISTNGSLMTEYIAKEIWSIGVRKMQVSIDYANPIRHDEYRGVAGAFAQAIACVKQLKKYPFRVKITSTLFSCDENDYNQLFALFLELQADVLYFLPARYKTINAEQYEKTMTLIRNFIKKNFEHKIILHDPSSNSINPQNPHYDKCIVGNVLYIAPDGTARLCPLAELSVGNVFKEGLACVWNKAERFFNNYTYCCPYFTYAFPI